MERRNICFCLKVNSASPTRGRTNHVTIYSACSYQALLENCCGISEKTSIKVVKLGYFWPGKATGFQRQHFLHHLSSLVILKNI